MASSSSLKQESVVPMNNTHINPEATYEAVVADGKLFMATLERLHARLGTKFMVPIIGGKELDLHKLFIEVTSRGGISKIVTERRWKEVTATFVFPPTATNASYVLRKYYFSLLQNYEQLYYFRSSGQTPPPDSIQNPSAGLELVQGAITPPQELLALTYTPQPMIGSSALPGGSSNAPVVNGIVNGRIDDGYLITVKIGTEELKGVLYELAPQQSHVGFPNNNANPQGITGGVTKRRRRRKKSEIKRRDPAHPKPNRSGYNFFFAEQHARLKQLNPGKDREISRMIGELWNKLNEQERSVYQEKAVEDKERYRTEMEVYREKLRTGEIVSNAVPLQQRLPEQNVEMAAEGDLPMGEVEEEDDDEEDDGSSGSGESHPSDPEVEEPSQNPLGLNLNSTQTEMVVVAPKEKADDAVVVAAEQN